MNQAIPDIPPIPDPVIVTQTGPQPPWEVMPPQVVAMIALAVVVGAVLILWPLARAIARRLEGGGDKKLRAEVDELRARLEAMETQAVGSGEFEAADHRMYELEERVQFVERLLARGTREGEHDAAS